MGGGGGGGGGAIGEKWVGAGVRWAWGFGKKSEFGAGVPEKEVREKRGGCREDKIGRE